MNLDVGLKRALLDLLRELLAGGNNAALYVTYDPREAVGLAGRLAVLEGGRIVQEGPLSVLRASAATTVVQRMLEDLGIGESRDIHREKRRMVLNDASHRGLLACDAIAPSAWFLFARGHHISD